MTQDKHHKKQTHQLVTEEFLQTRVDRAAEQGFPVAQWIKFCRAMMKDGHKVFLYEAKKTNSKYVTVARPPIAYFKVRFSDHRPIKHREANGDCDFFVGRTHFGVTTTAQAVAATRRFFQNETGKRETKAGSV